MPTWGWYVIGAGIFIVVYLYLQSSSNKTQVAQIPSSDSLQGFNNVVNLTGQILNQQQSELGGAGGAPPIQIHPAV